jgi:acyl-CoA reductase-like NAD-dependent aldehyde dehydrogenase
VRPPAFTEGIFGPVAPVAGYDTVDEAVDIINASEYGLSVAIPTGDAYGAIENGRPDQVRRGAHQRPDGRR